MMDRFAFSELVKNSTNKRNKQKEINKEKEIDRLIEEGKVDEATEMLRDIPNEEFVMKAIDGIMSRLMHAKNFAKALQLVKQLNESEIHISKGTMRMLLRESLDANKVECAYGFWYSICTTTTHSIDRKCLDTVTFNKFVRDYARVLGENREIRLVTMLAYASRQ